MTDRKPVILTTGDLRAYRVGLLHTHLETHPLVAMLDDLVAGRTLCVVKEPVAWWQAENGLQEVLTSHPQEWGRSDEPWWPLYRA